MKLLNVSEVAERLDLSTGTVWRMRTAGKLPEHVMVGGSVRWRETDIDRWVDLGCPTQQQFAQREKDNGEPD